MASSVPTTQVPVSFTEVVEVKSAAGVWTDPMPTALSEQVAFFKDQGFLIIPGVVGERDLEELDRELNRLAANYEKLPWIREGFASEPRTDPNRTTPTFRKIGGVSELSEAFGRLLRHRRILDVVHEILGPQLLLYRDVVMMKAARVGREKPWHQDSVYWPFRPMNLVSASTALDDATPENGCLQVIPGTHTREQQHYGKELRLDLSDEQQARAVYVPLKAGDTLLFHSLVLHASEPNQSDEDRRLCIFAYMAEGLEYIGKGERPRTPLVSRRQ